MCFQYSATKLLRSRYLLSWYSCFGCPDLKLASTLDPTNEEITRLKHDAEKATEKLAHRKPCTIKENDEGDDKKVEKPDGHSVKKKRIAIEEVEELPQTNDLYKEVVHHCQDPDDSNKSETRNGPSLLDSINTTLQQTKKPGGSSKPLITEIIDESKDSHEEEESDTNHKNTSKKVQEEKDASVESLEESHKVSEGIARLLADEWRAKGNKFFSAGNMIQAKDCYITSLKHDPSNIATLSNHAMCCLKLEQYEEAEEFASKAIDMDPSNVKCHYRRGCARRKQGNLAQARDDFQVVPPACQLIPHSCDVHWNAKVYV